MEQIAVLAALLIAILALLTPAIQSFFKAVLHRSPAWILAAPLLLTAIFSSAAELVHVRSLLLTLMLLAYTAAPVLCAYVQGPGPIARPSILDFLAILLLWLPLEFAAGASLIPRPAQGFLHSVAYGIAILLALVLFIGFRSIPGMKFNPPRAAKDYWLPLAAFAVTAPVLALVGVAIGFIPPPHAPTQSAGRMASAIAIIFAGTALPEEILFRSLIQNFLELRFGASIRTLLIAALIFGSAHLDNGPQPLPNWRYMILATIAGAAYGLVFRKSSTVLSSATLHMLVDWTKHFFF
ncbi:MAG TPA: type II CAAX endopeptidase family protein [Bryobacteraceae bacterium]|jgi:membrane protease YdiL (CAAX protease family)|nr:type II CAAX endopeptidase family protein [Bryobacteraceae bacterium]